MHSLEIVSPIPPIMTGTASYLHLIAKRMGGLMQALDVPVTIVCDDSEWPQTGPDDQMPEQFCGMAVTSYLHVPQDPPAGTTRIYFLANNDKHVYVHQMLARQSANTEGRVISVLHDPSMFMVHRHMARAPDVEFQISDLVEATRSQLGSSAVDLVRARHNMWLPDAFDYSTHCMGPALAKSDEIWTHSVYGANRVRFENDFKNARCKTVRVCSHPTNTVSPKPLARQAGEVFTMGVFGWVTPPKRLDSVMRGLAHALDRLPVEKGEKIKLQVVGRRTPKADYDPEALSIKMGLERVVEFIDYPSTEEFGARIAASDLVFNLRYPSCGETSGTLASAEHSGVKVVCSRYQSFREAEGVWRYVGVAAPYETLEISDAIVDALHEWLGESDTPSEAVQASPLPHPVATIDKVIVEEALKLLVPTL